MLCHLRHLKDFHQLLSSFAAIYRMAYRVASVLPPRPKPGLYPRPPPLNPFTRANDVNIEQQVPVPGEEAPLRAADLNLADQRRNIRNLRPGVFLQTKFPVRNRNSFWRAFAKGYYGDEDMWAWVKVETWRYFFSVLAGHPSHCRHALYAQLDSTGGLSPQLDGDNMEMRREFIFIMADLYDVQIIWVQGKDDNGKNLRDGRVASGMVAEVRGNNKCRQIVLFTPDRHANFLHWSLLTPVDRSGTIYPADHSVSDNFDSEE